MKKILILNLLSSMVFAANGQIYSNEDLKDVLGENPYEPNYFSMLLGLLFVVVMIYLTSYVYQKLVKVRLDKDVSDKEIEIVTSKSLGQNKNLYVIKVNNNHMLIGATQNNITYLKDIDNTNNKENIIDKTGSNS